jgi:glycosyltransferase involved in cell wall biosynthesis
MKILLLAPHPFYQERGTPIAVNLLLQSLSSLGHTVDVLTYPEGVEVCYPGVTLHRIRRPWGVRNIPPGPSVKKILCDAVMVGHALRLARQTRFDVVHAVEESVYMAMRIRRCCGTPYLYDMDSAMARQIAEKFPLLGFTRPWLERFERAATRGALAVVPVCEALAGVACGYGAARTFLLHDISLLQPADTTDREAVHALIPPAPETVSFMYVGNLESYQGVGLLLDSLARAVIGGPPMRLLIAGGRDADIRRYRTRADALGLGASVVFLGPQPVRRMAALFEAADVLVSPRIKGNNTPMKIYSYLASGKAVLATDLPTHTQVLTSDIARLADVRPEALADAMRQLAADPALRAALGARGAAVARDQHSAESFKREAAALYAWVGQALAEVASKAPPRPTCAATESHPL